MIAVKPFLAEGKQEGKNMERTNKLWILDSTLRDGAQGENISFSVQDKLRIVSALDQLGIDYIEAGNPASNPKDLEFFERVRALTLRYARLAAFGSTRRKDERAEDSEGLRALLQANTPAVCIFGKSWDFHVTHILHTTLEENLRMIEQSVAFLKANGREVIFDAEHFFDGYAWNPSYALASLEAAQRGGADCICLCETNGGAFPDQVAQVTAEAVQRLKAPVGIHTHNDGGMAVANSIVAVQAGASWVQGTLIGFGERCGNANLSTVMASSSFEHINPESVGNSRRFLISEVAGRSTLLERIRKIDPTVQRDDEITEKIIWHLKQLEHQGYQFEGAEATLEMLIRRQLGRYRPHFAVRKFKTIGEQQAGEEKASATALVKVEVGGQEEINAAEGDGPVNALDCALRKALERFFPILRTVHLTDYKVRVLDSRERTASKVRVLIESTDGQESWTTVGVSADIIEASLNALIDAIEYKLVHSSGREW